MVSGDFEELHLVSQTPRSHKLLMSTMFSKYPIKPCKYCYTTKTDLHEMEKAWVLICVDVKKLLENEASVGLFRGLNCIIQSSELKRNSFEIVTFVKKHSVIFCTRSLKKPWGHVLQELLLFFRSLVEDEYVEVLNSADEYAKIVNSADEYVEVLNSAVCQWVCWSSKL